MKKNYRGFLVISFCFFLSFTTINLPKKNLIEIDSFDTPIGDSNLIPEENLFKVKVNEEKTYWNTNENEDDEVHIEGTLKTTNHAEQMNEGRYWNSIDSRFYFHKQSKEEIISSVDLDSNQILHLIGDGRLSAYDCVITVNGNVTKNEGKIDLDEDNIILGNNNFTIDLMLDEYDIKDFQIDVEYYHLSVVSSYTFYDNTGKPIGYWYIDEDLNAIENPYQLRKNVDTLTPTLDVIIDEKSLLWLWVLLAILFSIIIVETLYILKNK